jgi:hypothetical protein
MKKVAPWPAACHNKAGLNMATQRESLGSGVLTAAPEAWPIPQEVAGVGLRPYANDLPYPAEDFMRLHMGWKIFIATGLFAGALGLAVRSKHTATRVVPEARELGSFVATPPSVPVVFTSRTEFTSFRAAADEGEGFTYPGMIPWAAREGRLRLLENQQTVPRRRAMRSGPGLAYTKAGPGLNRRTSEILNGRFSSVFRPLPSLPVPCGASGKSSIPSRCPRGNRRQCTP